MCASDLRETEELLGRARSGDQQALSQLLLRHGERLRRIVHLRMDRRLRGRIDTADVLQESLLEAIHCFTNYVKYPHVPFFLWLRGVTLQKLASLHRYHLEAQMRDVRREMRLERRGAVPEATSEEIAIQLLGRYTSPSQAAIRAELRLRVQEALETMDPIDREVLVLRHFERLTHGEAAQVLDIREAAVSKRYLRALKRLKRILRGFEGSSVAHRG